MSAPRLRFTAVAGFEVGATSARNERLEIDPVIDVEPGDVLMVTRTGERLGVRVVGDEQLEVRRGCLGTRPVALRYGDELVLLERAPSDGAG